MKKKRSRRTSGDRGGAVLVPGERGRGYLPATILGGGLKEAAEKNEEAQCEMLKPRIHEQPVWCGLFGILTVADKSDAFERVFGGSF